MKAACHSFHTCTPSNPISLNQSSPAPCFSDPQIVRAAGAWRGERDTAQGPRETRAGDPSLHSGRHPRRDQERRAVGEEEAAADDGDDGQRRPLRRHNDRFTGRYSDDNSPPPLPITSAMSAVVVLKKLGKLVTLLAIGSTFFRDTMCCAVNVKIIYFLFYFCIKIWARLGQCLYL